MSSQVPCTNATQKVLDGIKVAQTKTTGWSSLICCFQPMLAAAGVNASVARLAGIFGHAFSFYLKREPGGMIWQDENIDWSLFWENIDLVGCGFDEVQVIGRESSPKEVQDGKEAIWASVKSSIDRGMPALAWQAMTVEQKESGFDAYEWALLTGYNLEQKSYTVRHKARSAAYEIAYDGFGHSDGAEWLAVMWPTEPAPVDEDQVAQRSLWQAVEYAHGTKMDITKACYPADALGLAAYDLWRELLGSMPVGDAKQYAERLGWARGTAAAFCREIGPSHSAEAKLIDAAGHYEREVKALDGLHELCTGDSLSGESLEKAKSLLGEAIEAEREAVQVIEEVAGSATE